MRTSVLQENGMMKNTNWMADMKANVGDILSFDGVNLEVIGCSFNVVVVKKI